MEGLRNVVRRSSGQRSSSVLAPAETLNASGGGAVESVAVSSSSSSPPSLALASRPPRFALPFLHCFLVLSFPCLAFHSFDLL